MIVILCGTKSAPVNNANSQKTTAVIIPPNISDFCRRIENYRKINLFGGNSNQQTQKTKLEIIPQLAVTSPTP